MLVTVVIPLYNKAGTILRAIRSVQAQTHDQYELVIVDDGSTDVSVAVVKQLDDASIRLVQQPNAGPGAARNAGAQAGRGELIAFLDADDEWKDDFLATAVRALSDNPDCGTYACGYDAGAYRGQRPNKVAELGLRGPHMLRPELSGAEVKKHVDALHSSCTVVRRALFEQAGGFFAKYRCLYGEDSFLWIHALFLSQVYWDPEDRIVFHVEDSALGYAVQRRSTARPIVEDGMQELSRQVDPRLRPALSRTVQYFAQMDSHILAVSGCFREAAALRSRYGLGSALSPLLDRLRFLKAHTRQLIR